MVKRRIINRTKKNDEPDVDSLAKEGGDSKKRNTNSKTAKGKADSAKNQLHGTIATYVREQILKDRLAGVQDMKRMQIVAGRGGKDLELLSQDLATGYERTAKDRLITDAKKELDSKGKKRGKVLLKKVSEDDIY